MAEEVTPIVEPVVEGADDKGRAGLIAAVQAERDKAKVTEARAVAAETELQAFRDKDLSETEKLTKKAADAEARAVAAETAALTTAKTSALKVALVQAGAVNAARAIKLIDLADFEVDDDGSSAAALVEALKESDAYLFGEAKEEPTVERIGSGGMGDRGTKTATPVQKAWGTVLGNR